MIADQRARSLGQAERIPCTPSVFAALEEASALRLTHGARVRYPASLDAKAAATSCATPVRAGEPAIDAVRPLFRPSRRIVTTNSDEAPHIVLVHVYCAAASPSR